MPKKSMLQFDVTDTGIGIPDNEIQNNWMEHVRPHHSENSDYNIQK